MALTVVNVAVTLDHIKSIERAISEQENSLAQVNKEVEFMTDAWKSQAQQVYVQKYDATRKEVEQFNISLKDYMRMMKGVVDDCADTDKSVSASLRVF
jgi:uncharacterized protein YukE